MVSIIRTTTNNHPTAALVHSEMAYSFIYHLRTELLDTLHNYRLAKELAKQYYGDWANWSYYMQVCAQLKKQLKHVADTLHLALYGFEFKDRKRR